MKNEVRIVIAARNPVFRKKLVNILSKENNFIICVAGDGYKALDIIRNEKPDIAILDISMSGYSGIEIARIIMNEELHTLSVMLAMYNAEEYLDDALENDVKGYLLKDSTSLEIAECINIILNGGYYISKRQSDYILKNIKNNTCRNDFVQQLNSLTRTEKQVLKLLSENKTSTQIANEMFVSFRTIQNHRIKIARKLDLTEHNNLLLFAIENKIRI